VFHEQDCIIILDYVIMSVRILIACKFNKQNILRYLPCRSWNPLPIHPHDPQVQQTSSRLGSHKRSEKNVQLPLQEYMCLAEGSTQLATHINRPWKV
jgi:hypothetical protein